MPQKGQKGRANHIAKKYKKSRIAKRYELTGDYL
jgi:hypothetical protein